MSLLKSSKENLEKEKSLNRQSPCFTSMFIIIKIIWMKSNAKIKNLKQYGRRYCVRIEVIPSVEYETSDEVLDNAISLLEEAECDVPECEVLIDRAHRIGKSYVEKQL